VPPGHRKTGRGLSSEGLEIPRWRVQRKLKEAITEPRPRLWISQGDRDVDQRESRKIQMINGERYRLTLETEGRHSVLGVT